MNMEQIQTFLDAGYSSNRIAKYYGVHHSKIDRIIRRHGLEIYEAFDENGGEVTTWDFDDDFKPYKTSGGYMDKTECMLDAIAEFIRKHDPDEITIELLKKYRYIERYSYKIFGNLPTMYEYFNVDKSAVEYSMNKKVRACAIQGHDFQILVKKVFDELLMPYVYEQKYSECRPDFRWEDQWYDAKLSRSTALNPSCETIEKYRKHTDYLTIIYAIDDTTATDDRASFVHISEYYPYISSELQREIDAFIRKASQVKFGGESFGNI